MQVCSPSGLNTTADPLLTHRVDCRTFVERYAVPTVPNSILKHRDHWLEMNAKYFAGEIRLHR